MFCGGVATRASTPRGIVTADGDAEWEGASGFALGAIRFRRRERKMFGSDASDGKRMCRPERVRELHTIRILSLIYRRSVPLSPLEHIAIG